MKEVKEKKDTFYSKLSFALSLCFWIPLLNVPLSISAIAFGIAALKLIHNSPERYGGRIYAVIGIILGALPLILILTALIIPMTREQIFREIALAIPAK